MTYLGVYYYWGDPKHDPPRVELINYNPIIFRLKEKEYTSDELKEYAKSSQGKKELHPISRLIDKVDFEIWKFFYENYEKDIDQEEKYKSLKVKIKNEINKLWIN